MHINDHVNHYENMESMIALAKRLSSSPMDIVEPGRKIIKQGSLMKVGTLLLIYDIDLAIEQ